MTAKKPRDRAIVSTIDETHPACSRKDADDATFSVRDALETARNEVENRDSVGYDGLVGRPPQWMPQPLVYEFRQVRRRLLDPPVACDCRSHSRELTYSWMNAYRDVIGAEEDFVWMERIPPEHIREIESLVYIQNVASLGEDEGIKAYLGEGAHSVVRGQAIQEKEQKQRRLGTKRSAEVRRARNEERDRRIHDSVRKGKVPKQIADDEGISVSRVHTILRNPRP